MARSRRWRGGGYDAIAVRAGPLKNRPVGPKIPQRRCRRLWSYIGAADGVPKCLIKVVLQRDGAVGAEAGLEIEMIAGVVGVQRIGAVVVEVALAEHVTLGVLRVFLAAPGR
jgi:hypothetical protein